MTEMFSHLAGPALILFQGLPASGKTERAKREILAVRPGRIVRVNRDDLRRSMCVKPTFDRDLRTLQEERVTVAQHAMIRALLNDDAVVIVDDTNLISAHVTILQAIAAELGADFRLVDDFLTVSPEECIERDKHRVPSEMVGETVILSMWHRFLAERESRAV